MLADRPLRDLLALFASADPTPGGGSATALASTVGVSLLRMVVALPKTRSGSDADRAALTGMAAALTGVQQRLTEAIDEDAAAYAAVIAAYKHPKATKAEAAAGQAAIQRALRNATDVPLGVARLSAVALKHAESVAAHGRRAAAGDVGVAVALLRAGLEGARLTVTINLRSLSDAAYAEAVTAEVSRLKRSADESAAAAEHFLADA